MTQRSAPDTWLDEHGDALYSYAYLRLRDTQTAEDIVQETLLAAWRSHRQFSGNSSERTWLIGILKHKLADYWRAQRRRIPIAESADTHADPDDAIETTFDATARDHWRVAPAPWLHPDGALEQQQFWEIFVDCVAKLPPAQARAFSLCELDGLKGEEICKVLGVAPTNLWVMLHRARLRLRQCLENRWFKHEPE